MYITTVTSFGHLETHDIRRPQSPGRISTQTTMNCSSYLPHIEEHNIISGWLPGHFNIQGNAIADVCARVGSGARVQSGILDAKIAFLELKNQINEL